MVMMTCWSWLAGLCLLLQVPPPAQGAETGQRLEAARRSIILREAAELGALADSLARGGKPDAAKLVRAQLPRVELPNGPTRFIPLPEVVEPRKPADAGLPSEVRADSRARCKGPLRPGAGSRTG